jgi:hypothetical protein
MCTGVSSQAASSADRFGRRGYGTELKLRGAGSDVPNGPGVLSRDVLLRESDKVDPRNTADPGDGVFADRVARSTLEMPAGMRESGFKLATAPLQRRTR